MSASCETLNRLHIQGIEGIGKIEAARFNGWTTNDVPNYVVTVEVTLPGRDPYTATATVLKSHAEAEFSLRPGFEVPVKVDPKDPDNIVLQV